MLFRTCIFLLLISAAASAEEKVSVAQLSQQLAADHNQADSETTKHLLRLSLTERLSAATLRRLLAVSPGPAASQELTILADQSEFLPLPATEIPSLPNPDLAAQKKILDLVVIYVSKTIHRLPDFYTTRVTQEFIDEPFFSSGTLKRPYRPLHRLDSYRSTLTYQGGKTLVTHGPTDSETSQQEKAGLQEWEIFGTGLSTMFLDAARSDLHWSHWEQTETDPRAVFSYDVPKGNSHYEVRYCCVPNADPEIIPLELFHRVVGFHGEITVDPKTGAILRVTVMAALSPGDYVSQADTMIEYGPVEIDGATFISATRSVNISKAIPYGIVSRNQNEPSVRSFGAPYTLIKDSTFQQFHLLQGNRSKGGLMVRLSLIPR